MELVFDVAEVIDPLPVTTAYVTPTPGTGFPEISSTRTFGAIATLVWTVADWLSPAVFSI
ncbi:unannotated protein [freshwater metagenome]|uniref:Unannotated protein n=1 Tax=freshwater metagenome TaxID=449393 RepID=A0A6J5ZK73_9ZZZZ